MNYHFCSSQDTDFRNDFKSFYESNEELRGDGGGGKNFYSWYSSRLALLKCLDDMNMSLPINRLKSTNHLHIDEIPHLRVSWTHTEYIKGMFLSGAVLAHKNEFQSIGIDIEETGRKISDKIKSKFYNSGDADLSPIEIWVRKEACYKAISPLLVLDGEKPALFNEIATKENEFSFERDTYNFSGTLSDIKLEFDERDFLSIIATIQA